MDVKYPDVTVKLTGQDGNAFSILGKVMRALHHHNVPSEELRRFQNEATSGDYNHLLATCMKWINIE